jgi:hypothetical protein
VPRVDVTLRGLPPTNVPATVSPSTVARNALVPVPTIGAGILIPATAIARTATVPTAGVITPSRDDLVIGVDEPTALNTGTYPGIALETVSGNVTLSTEGQTYANKDVFGRITITAANVTVLNCKIRGTTSTQPSEGTALIDCTSNNCVNATIVDCELVPDHPHWNWDSAIKGHNYTALRCNIHHVTDGFNVFWSGQGNVYDSGVTIQQCYVHDLAFWTASSNGVVHPSDTITHNDCIQHQGGRGTQMLGNALWAYHSHQYAHWHTVGASEVEDYNFIALQSLASGTPFFGGPFQFPVDRGTGTNATGRYHLSSIATLMIGHDVGRSGTMTFHDNWCYGGNFSVNCGVTRNASLGDTSLGSFLRNRFDQGQGQGTQPHSTQTINVNSTWAGNVTSGAGTADRNFYMADDFEINFRGD